MLAARIAWLRRHHSAAFLAVQFDAAAGSPRRLAALADEARELGIGVLAPDVRRWKADCSVEEGCVRLGLALVRGMTTALARRLASLADRERVPTVEAWLARAGADRIPRPLLRHLGAAGALDGFGHPRAALVASAEVFVRRTAQLRELDETGQQDLFERGGPGADGSWVVASPSWDAKKQTLEQRASLGIAVGPLALMCGKPLSSTDPDPPAKGVPDE